MNNVDALKTFVKADKSVISYYSKSKNLITEFIYCENNEVIEKSNYTLNEFAAFIKKFYKVNIDLDAVKDASDKIMDEKGTFSIPVFAKNDTDTPQKLVFKGGLVNDDIIAVAIISYKNKEESSIDTLTKCEPVETLINAGIKNITTKTNFILGVIDIDDFKGYNDKYGDVYGDIVLIELAKTLKDKIADKGIISRIGGDAFAFIYKIEDDYNLIRSFVLDVKTTIKDNINKSFNNETELTTTIGISRSFVDGTDFNLLYNKALKALERGKKKSRDCFIIYFEEKCGVVDNVNRIGKIHYEESSTANYSGISAVVEVLNSNLPFGRRINETMSLIGSFFMLDRITIIENDSSANVIKNVLSWYNPRSPKEGYNFTNDMIGPWRKALGKSNLVVVENSYKVENEVIRDSLLRSNIYAVVASELINDGKCFGLIQFEMTSHTRSWKKENVMALGLLVKIIATKYGKEYDQYVHFKKMYFDNETELYNLHKWYDDVNLFLENNKIEKKIDKFTILDIGIMKYSTLVGILGLKVVRKILKAIADSFRGLEDMGVIYCRSYDNRFTLFVPNDDTYLVKNLYKRVLNAVEEIRGEDGEKVSLRAGYSVIDIDTMPEELDEVVDRAITARQKTTSTEPILEFNDEMIVNDKFKTMLVSHIDSALANNEFLVYLQPKISTETGKIAGAEALTRWNYNFEELIYPDVFIPLLEANGYIAKLDFKVFENVCIFIKELEKENKKIVPISVNVSRAIKDFKIYFNKLERIRKKYDVDPKYIEIEITEGMYSLANEAIENFISNLHEVGYKVSMDDFGSGNSNISTLSQLTFDTIKFDRGFFNDIDNEKERMIIDTMTKLVKGMNMKVVCEGIETEDYVEYLTKIGADYIQGYFYDKPIEINKFKEKYLS